MDIETVLIWKWRDFVITVCQDKIIPSTNKRPLHKECHNYTSIKIWRRVSDGGCNVAGSSPETKSDTTCTTCASFQLGSNVNVKGKGKVVSVLK
jgi:hypothetical protein